MTQRSDALRSVAEQLRVLVAVPGGPLDVAALAGPRHLFRAVAAVQRDGVPEPLVGVDSDGDLQCRWTAGGTELVLTVEDRGAGYLWATDADGTELLYAEWTPSQDPQDVLSSASQLLSGAAGAAVPA